MKNVKFYEVEVYIHPAHEIMPKFFTRLYVAALDKAEALYECRTWARRQQKDFPGAFLCLSGASYGATTCTAGTYYRHLLDMQDAHALYSYDTLALL